MIPPLSEEQERIYRIFLQKMRESKPQTYTWHKWEPTEEECIAFLESLEKDDDAEDE